MGEYKGTARYKYLGFITPPSVGYQWFPLLYGH